MKPKRWRTHTTGCLELKHIPVNSSIMVICLPRESNHTQESGVPFIQRTYGIPRRCLCLCSCRWMSNFICFRVCIYTDRPQWTLCLRVFGLDALCFVRHELCRSLVTIWSHSLLMSHGAQTQSPGKSSETKRITITALSHQNLLLTLTTACHSVRATLQIKLQPNTECFFFLFWWLYNGDKLQKKKTNCLSYVDLLCNAWKWNP